MTLWNDLAFWYITVGQDTPDCRSLWITIFFLKNIFSTFFAIAIIISFLSGSDFFDWLQWSMLLLASSSPVVNFTKILRAAFAPIFYRLKITKPSCNKRKAALNTFIPTKKLLVKLTLGVNFINILCTLFPHYPFTKKITKSNCN